MGSEGAWQLDLEGARNYERFLVAALMGPWARGLTEVAGIRAGERVLDVACGTGVVAREATRRVGSGGSVAGVDVNAAMLTVAREVTAEVEPAITWHQAPAERLPFDAATFDVALCQQGLQFFDDAATALAELHRVVAPGGRLALSTCRTIEHQAGYATLATVATEHLGVTAGEILRSPYAAGDPGELRRLAEKAGFHSIHIVFEVTPMRVPSARALLEGETMSSPLGDIVASLDAEVVDRLVDDLATALAPHTDDDGVIFPFQTTVLTARR